MLALLLQAGTISAARKDGGWRVPRSGQLKSVAGMNPVKLDKRGSSASRRRSTPGWWWCGARLLVYEKYRAGPARRESRHGLLRKAWTSIACGILLKEKKDQLPTPGHEGVHGEVSAGGVSARRSRRAEITLASCSA